MHQYFGTNCIWNDKPWICFCNKRIYQLKHHTWHACTDFFNIAVYSRSKNHLPWMVQMFQNIFPCFSRNHNLTSLQHMRLWLLSFVKNLLVLISPFGFWTITKGLTKPLSSHKTGLISQSHFIKFSCYLLSAS